METTNRAILIGLLLERRCEVAEVVVVVVSLPGGFDADDTTGRRPLPTLLPQRSTAARSLSRGGFPGMSQSTSTTV
ncbi:MAG: hypothetical protein FWH11_13645 [Micrococcales bacterium]|nr:hypothetical protein [Micrococcales bacterium]